ncbi:hypothetical protein [uncultured Polaribacter sp.]|uniref:hypothetical protein n=1 Tax=uncultured Polaribacter sp. TaxID=174711 RepID=UPI0026203297|nr:hypothetical protein [uncultured Polaribacter sp.]
MKRDTFIQLLESKGNIQQVETAELKSIVEEFPYFQAARALYLKGLKNTDSFKYNNELKHTAAYTTDRTILFEYITSEDFKNKENIHQQISEKITNTIASSEKKVDEKSNVKVQSNLKKDLDIGKPLSFTSTESHSFNQWLQLSTQNKVIRHSIKKEKSTETLISKFIENNPKIEPLEKGKSITIPIAENKQDDALMTETLAKVYLEQKKYENAMQAYRILSLKYPEKSGFFADQIKRIEILQKK